MASQNRHVEFDGKSSGMSRPARNAFAWQAMAKSCAIGPLIGSDPFQVGLGSDPIYRNAIVRNSMLSRGGASSAMPGWVKALCAAHCTADGSES